MAKMLLVAGFLHLDTNDVCAKVSKIELEVDWMPFGAIARQTA